MNIVFGMMHFTITVPIYLRHIFQVHASLLDELVFEYFFLAYKCFFGVHSLKPYSFKVWCWTVKVKTFCWVNHCCIPHVMYAFIVTKYGMKNEICFIWHNYYWTHCKVPFLFKKEERRRSPASQAELFAHIKYFSFLNKNVTLVLCIEPVTHTYQC